MSDTSRPAIPPETLLGAFLDGTLDETQAKQFGDFLAETFAGDPSGKMLERKQKLWQHFLLDCQLYDLEKGFGKSPTVLNLLESMNKGDSLFLKKKFPEKKAVSDERSFISEMDALALHAAESAMAAMPSQGVPQTVTSKNRPEKLPSRLSLISKAAILLGVLLFGGLIFSELFTVLNGVPDIPKPSYAAATVVGGLDVVWGESEARSFGTPLGNELMQFESGIVELLFYNGVYAVVEGPAELVFKGKNRVFCRKGIWSVDVPERAHGFEIQTQQCLIRDLGTRFRAEIDHDAVRVDMVRGEVEIEGPDSRKTSLATRQGIILLDGTLENIPARTDRFVGRLAMRQRMAECFSRSSSGAFEDPKPFLDFKFDPDTPATAIGGVWVEGEAHDSRAFRLADPNARIHLNASGRLCSFSIVARLKIKELHNRLNAILATEGNTKNGLIWHVTQYGSIVFGLRHRTGHQAEIHETPVVFTPETLDRWVWTAVAVDAVKRTITILVDGAPVLTAPLAFSPTWNLAGTDVGNWMPKKNSGKYLEPLDGAVDEIVIYDKALSSDELRRMYFKNVSGLLENNLPKGAGDEGGPENQTAP